jgi:two-component system chemotaxis response regulator CheB
MSKVVVIGGSAGAIEALKIILAALPKDFPAGILIVTHIGVHKSILPQILQRITPLTVRHAADGEPVTPGRVLMAPSDEHLTVVNVGGINYVRLLHGPKENHCRPAIDPLFRSAAIACGTEAIGVVLTGYLDDGTVGLQAIEARGGMTIVQDPADAEVPDMPASALQHVVVDFTLRVNLIADALVRLAGTAAPAGEQVHETLQADTPDWIDMENRLTGKESDMNDLEKIGDPSSLTCPECSGAMWEIRRPGPVRYRCHTGHAFTARVLASLQSSTVEDAIWGAIRALHEQERLFTKIGERSLQAGLTDAAAEYKLKAELARKHSQSLRDVITARALVVNAVAG